MNGYGSKVGYPNNCMCNTKNRLKSMVPIDFNFDQYPNIYKVGPAS